MRHRALLAAILLIAYAPIVGLGVAVLSASEIDATAFETHHLKYGISIGVPKGWRIIERHVTEQLDARTQSLTGIDQSNNDILIAANLDDPRGGRAAATLRVSVRLKATMSQSAVMAMSQAQLDIEAANAHKIALATVAKSGDATMEITMYQMGKELLAGLTAIRADYQEVVGARKQNVSVYSFFLGDRIIKLTASFDDSQRGELGRLIAEIKRSLIISPAMTAWITDKESVTLWQDGTWLSSRPRTQLDREFDAVSRTIGHLNRDDYGRARRGEPAQGRQVLLDGNGTWEYLKE